MEALCVGQGCEQVDLLLLPLLPAPSSSGGQSLFPGRLLGPRTHRHYSVKSTNLPAVAQGYGESALQHLTT